MPPLTVLLLARPDEPGLGPLTRLPGDVRLVRGETAEALAAAAPDAEVILHASGSSALLERVVGMAPRLKWIHARPAGVDHLLYPSLADTDVVLTNAKGVFSRSLAEFVMTGVLFFAKDVRGLVRRQEASRWEQRPPDLVQGRTMGIIGFGDIGRATARLARAFGMRILALRRSAAGGPPAAGPDPLADEVLGVGDFDLLLRRAEYVVLATPLTAETRRLLSAERIARLRADAVVINVGRGPVVQEEALVEALRHGRIRGAALDVFETEPLPAGHPLWTLDNVLLSPHCADHTVGWQEEALEVFLENLDLYRRGDPLRNVVDKRRGY